MSDIDIDRIMDVANEAADRAAAVLMDLFGGVAVEYKGEIDLVTEADRRAEQIIVDLIQKEFPDHGIVAEESGEHEGSQGAERVRWYIDPIDGTTNYAHGLPLFATSIGVAVDGQLAVGIINNPAYKERYTAQRGHGAFLNGRPIRVSHAPTLKQSLLVTGFPYHAWESEQNNIDHFANFTKHSRGIRRIGSAALDLAYVARGSLDGYWETSLHSWDMAAGWLLVEEAGGTVTDLKGNPMNFAAQQILATNGKVHNEMIDVLRRGKTGMDGPERW